jgi:hypothetical protein
MHSGKPAGAGLAQAGPRHEIVNVLGIREPEWMDHPRAEVHGYRLWEPWLADIAAQR